MPSPSFSKLHFGPLLATGSTPSPATSAPGDRAQEFVPVQGGQDTTSAEALLVAAYVIMWLLALLFVWSSWRRQRRLETRLDQIERALAERTDAPADT